MSDLRGKGLKVNINRVAPQLSRRSITIVKLDHGIRVKGPHLVSGQPSSIHVHSTRIAIRVPFQTNLGSTSSKCGQFYSSSIQLYRARLKRRARRTQSALIDLSFFGSSS